MAKPTVNIQFRISPELAARIEAAAASSGVTKTALIIRALEEYLKEGK